MRAQRKLRSAGENEPMTCRMADERHTSRAQTDSLASPTFFSLDEMQRWVFRRLLIDGVPASPRGLPTLEVISTHLVLLNPRRRILTNAARKWSLPLAIGEFCWHLSASNESAFIQYSECTGPSYVPRQLRLHASTLQDAQLRASDRAASRRSPVGVDAEASILILSTGDCLRLDNEEQPAPKLSTARFGSSCITNKQ